MASKSAKSASKKPKAKVAPAPNSELFSRIEQCINEKIRPFIQMDGGEIELVELTPEKILRIRLHGACHGCMASAYTLQFGVQNALNEEFPEEDIQLQLVENSAPITNPKFV